MRGIVFIVLLLGAHPSLSASNFCVDLARHIVPDWGVSPELREQGLVNICDYPPTAELDRQGQERLSQITLERQAALNHKIWLHELNLETKRILSFIQDWSQKLDVCDLGDLASKVKCSDVHLEIQANREALISHFDAFHSNLNKFLEVKGGQDPSNAIGDFRASLSSLLARMRLNE